jgi:protein gp37
MTKFSISAELESFLPSTTEDERKALRQSLAAEGCLQPLTVWTEEQVLVDGHNRYRICVDEGIPFTVTERSFPNLGAVKEWMLLQQLCRRNLSDNHRRWCLGQLYERRKGEKGNKTGANQHTKGSEVSPQNGDKPKGRVVDQVAAETGTSKNTVERSAAFTRTVEALAKPHGPSFRDLCLNTNKFTDGSLQRLLELHGKDPVRASAIVAAAPHLGRAGIIEEINQGLDDWLSQQREDKPVDLPAPAPRPTAAAASTPAVVTPAAPVQPPARKHTPPSPPEITEIELADGKKGFIQSRPGYRSTFNETNAMVDWAKWTWNPITGCHHGCEYCYARDIALSEKMKSVYITGFEPTFHPERLQAPANTTARNIYGQKDKNVFVCSMADLFGKWVPLGWIQQVMDAMIANPQWTYLCLTKFPQRLKEINDLYGGFPDHVWVGTSIDNQARVGLAERCFKEIDAKVKWLSCEPLIVPLRFEDLSGFDWVVIGGQSAQNGLPSFTPPLEWVGHVYDVAKRDGCKVFCKTENMPHMTREVAW